MIAFRRSIKLCRQWGCCGEEGGSHAVSSLPRLGGVHFPCQDNFQFEFGQSWKLRRWRFPSCGFPFGHLHLIIRVLLDWIRGGTFSGIESKVVSLVAFGTCPDFLIEMIRCHRWPQRDGELVMFILHFSCFQSSSSFGDDSRPSMPLQKPRVGSVLFSFL